jgi:hypothetical protein
MDYLPHLLTAMALILVLEGIFPFLSPCLWRKVVQKVADRTDQSLRLFGLFCMLLGAGLMYYVHTSYSL